MVKICDFGWSTVNSGRNRSFCGTLDYVSPEMVSNKIYDHKIDVWAIGVIIYEMVAGFYNLTFYILFNSTFFNTKYLFLNDNLLFF